MRRRPLLVALSGSLAAAAGCLDVADGDDVPTATDSSTDGSTTRTSTAPSPSPVLTDRSTPRSDVAIETSLEMEPADFDTRTDGSPAVDFQDSETDVVVSGRMRYGSSTCDEIRVVAAEWTDGRTVRVTVAAVAKTGDVGTCTADIATADYVLSLSTGASPVKRLVVVEIPYDGDERRRTATPTG